MASTIQANAALLSSLVAYYKLDGNANDAHTNGLNGTPENSPTYATARLRNGVQINGSNQAISLGTSALFSPANITVCGWGKLDSTSAAFRMLIGRRYEYAGETENGSWFIQFSQTAWEAGVYTGAGNGVRDQASLASLIDTNWHFFALAFDGTTIKFFVDNVITRKTHSSPGSISTSTLPVLIGACATSPNPTGRWRHWYGMGDEFSIFNRCLTDEEILFLYHSGYPVHYDEVLAPSLASIGTSGLEDMRSLALLEPSFQFVPVTGFEALTGPAQRQISLSWVNPVHADFLEVIVRRSDSGYPASPDSGDLAYQGAGTGFVDSDLEPDHLYYYSVFAFNVYHDYSEAVQDSALSQELDRAKFTAASAVGKDVVRATFDQQMLLGENDETDVLVAGNWDFTTLAHEVTAISVSLVQISPTIVDIQLDGEGTAGADYTATVAATVQASDHRTMDAGSRSQEFTGLGEMPRVESAVSIGLFRVAVQFSEAVLGADDVDNYSIPGLVLSGAYLLNDFLHQYVVRTNQQTPGFGYTVEVTGVTDLVGGPMDPEHNTYGFEGYNPSSSYAAHPQDQGMIEAVTGAIGESCTEMGGLVSTRLIAVVEEGETTLPVETTEGWPEAGRCAVEGVPYTYSGKTATTLTGLQHIRAGEVQAGTAMLHHVESLVTDISRERSFLEKLRRAMLLDYAEGEDLNAIGRNFGLIRHPVFTEDRVYREVIRGMAYNPKGSMLGMELALTGMAGAGNFEIYEDLIRYPCQVFVRLTGEALIHSAQAGTGKAWMNDLSWGVLYGSANAIDVPSEPLSVYGVQLKGLQEIFDFRTERPSEVLYDYYPGVGTPENAFTYAGSLTEGTAVTVEGGQCKLACGSAGTVFYRMLDTQGARITPESLWAVALLLYVPTAASLKHGELAQASLAVFDGGYRMSCGLEDDLTFGLFATSGGGFLGATATLARDTYYTVEMRHTATGRIELSLNGQLISSVARADFAAAPTTDHQIEWGIRGTPNSGMALWAKQLRAAISTATDYWSGRGVDGSVDDAAPSQLTIGGATHAFLSTDVGKPLRTYGSAVANAQGGNNNGRWRIATYISPAAVTLRGYEQVDAETNVGYPKRITIPLFDGIGPFVYPDDLGKKIVISGSDYGKNGTYVIAKLFNPVSGADYATEHISGKARARTCEVVAATFVTEVGLTWELQPAFADESGLCFEMSGTGSFSGTVLTLRQPLWKNDLLMEVLAISEHSAQLLPSQECVNLVEAEGPPPAFAYYPWYVVDPLGMLRPFVDQLTAAGVVPEYFIGDELYGY